MISSWRVWFYFLKPCAFYNNCVLLSDCQLFSNRINRILEWNRSFSAIKSKWIPTVWVISLKLLHKNRTRNSFDLTAMHVLGGVVFCARSLFWCCCFFFLLHGYEARLANLIRTVNFLSVLYSLLYLQVTYVKK